MNNAIDRITLDVHKAVSQVSLIWKRGDTARTIEAVLTDNGKPFVLDRCTVSFTAADALPALHYCEIKDNRIIYNAAPIVTQNARSLLCEFRVIGADGKVLSAPRFTIDVRDTVIDPDVVEETEKGNIGTLDKLISDAAEIVEEIETKLDNGELDGKDGKDGTIWHFGTVILTGFSHISKVPGAKNGDWYLNTNTYDIFVADDDYWGYRGNIKGADGKSAYQYAKEAGFPGTEADFAEILASIGSGGGGTVNLSDYYKKAETYNRSEIDNKVGAVAANAQPKGDYALRSELPSVPVKSVNGKTGAVQLTASDVGADKSGTAASAVSGHNASKDSHNDIRLLIDAITVPTKLSELSEDSAHRLVSDADKLAWNNKSDFSGAYADLSGKPTIPTVPTKVSAFENDKGYLTSFTESDPTVPAWAKSANKPSYTKSEVGLGNVDNVKQYSASNPPPYPVTSVNGKTGTVSLKASDVGAAPSDKTITIKGVDENGDTHTWTVYGV